ncbi:MAG: UDP-N-acetylmuramate dehydrogenase [Myxococcota bacterium]
MSEHWADRLARIDGVDVRRDVSLRSKTSFRIGGPAEALAVPGNVGAVADVWRFADETGVSLTILGGGTNILVADDGVAGIVVELGDAFAAIDIYRDHRHLRHHDGSELWHVGAACGTGKLVRRAADCGMRGLEVLAGVPGTLGGALIMNAGGVAEIGGDLASVVRRVQLVVDGTVRWIEAAEAGFAYRRSRFPAASIILGAELELMPGNAEALRDQIKASQARRRVSQPLELRNAGSIFKNPEGDYAGRLIEAAGCKGWREGDAEVSERHANFIVNRGEARAVDVVRLIERVRGRVSEQSGVRLELEVRLLGLHHAEEES